MLTHLHMKAGPSPGAPALSIPLTPVTVFVGPNNSGKSRALVEIQNFLTSKSTLTGKVVQGVDFYVWNKADFEIEFQKICVEPRTDERLLPGHSIIEKIQPQSGTITRIQVQTSEVFSGATTPNYRNRSQYCYYLSLVTLRLDGQNRLSLIKEQKSGDLLQPPSNHFEKLFKDREARLEIRRIVYDAFGKYLVVDPTNIGHLRLRLSDRPPEDDQEEQGWDERARLFHSAATLISEASDGVKAFVGMLTTLIAGEPKNTLIDEPEAFLHPTLSTRLGKEITNALVGSHKRLFIATHSANFIMGCVQGGAPINIVRLTHQGNASTARLLGQEKLIPLMRNPLLRSIGVLNALFYNAVIVTEADADRAFYQEINERLIQAKDPRGIEGCLFLNAQNKQTIWDIVHPLRELGIPAAGIVDIDVLKEGGAVWSKPMHGAFVPSVTRAGFETIRSNLYQLFKASNKDMKRDGGIKILSQEGQQACEDFFLNLAEYGIFVVPTGEIESWLQSSDLNRDKYNWLKTVFEAMGEDPESPEYVKPALGDVWDFIGNISKWVNNPSRKGIPD